MPGHGLPGPKSVLISPLRGGGISAGRGAGGLMDLLIMKVFEGAGPQAAGLDRPAEAQADLWTYL